MKDKDDILEIICHDWNRHLLTLIHRAMTQADDCCWGEEVMEMWGSFVPIMGAMRKELRNMMKDRGWE